MDALIREMYKDAMIAEDLRDLIFQASLNNGWRISDAWNRAKGRLRDFAMRLAEREMDAARDLLVNWEKTGSGESDFRSLAGKAEGLLLPSVYRALEIMYGNIDLDVGSWHIEKTPTAFLTIREIKSGRYLHNPYDPMWEATVLANELYHTDMDTFHILGCGLGYLPYQIWMRSRQSAHLYVYEEDEIQLSLAREMGALGLIDSDHITIVDHDDVDQMLLIFLQTVKEGQGNYYVSDWKSGSYYASSLGSDIAQIDYDTRTDRIMRFQRSANIRENKRRDCKNIDELLSDLNDVRECVIVSAGPSLDENIDFIRESIGHRLIISVNTSLRRLASEDIRPDIITILDPIPKLKKHLEGLEDFTEGIPLVMPISGNADFASIYRGPIYIVPENDHEWGYGGMVASLALELAFHLKASKVYLVGSDLAYPGGNNYADGVAHERKEGMDEGQQECIHVLAVDGETVCTSALYNFYRQILEKQIALHPQVRVFNMSEHGAMICGTFDKNAKDVEIPEHFRIIEANEAAFQKRYGRSLTELLYNTELSDPYLYEGVFHQSVTLAGRMGKTPEEIRLMVCLGFAEGSCLEQILAEASNVQRILVYEPNLAMFLYACCTRNLEKLLGDARIEVILAAPGKDVAGNLEEPVKRCVDPLNIYHMYGRVIPGYGQLYAGMLDQVIDAVKSVLLIEAANMNVLIPHSREIFRNQLYALAAAPYSGMASKLFLRIGIKDIPIVLVGAGPSLEKNAGALKDAKGKALIISCSRAAQTLENNGITPDIVASIDYLAGHDYSAHDIDRRYTMLFHVQTAADIQERYYGKGIYFGFDTDFFNVTGLENDAAVQAGGSVITAVFSLLVESGFTNIVLVGEDLAYAEDGQAHSGTFVDRKNEMTARPVDGISGNKVLAREDWEAFLRFFEMKIAERKELHVVDATEGGALIHGTEVITLKEAVGRMSRSYPVDEWVDVRKCQSDVSTEDVLEELLSYVKTCTDTRLLLEEGQKYSNYLITKYSNRNNKEYSEKLVAYNTCYEKIIDAEDGDLLKAYCGEVYFSYADDAQYLDAGKEGLKTLKREARLISELLDAVEELRSYLDELIADLKCKGTK